MFSVVCALYGTITGMIKICNVKKYIGNYDVTLNTKWLLPLCIDINCSIMMRDDCITSILGYDHKCRASKQHPGYICLLASLSLILSTHDQMLWASCHLIDLLVHNYLFIYRIHYQMLKQENEWGLVMIFPVFSPDFQYAYDITSWLEGHVAA